MIKNNKILEIIWERIIKQGKKYEKELLNKEANEKEYWNKENNEK